MNKFEWNKKYFTISVYALGVIFLGAMIIRACIFWDDTRNFIADILRMLSPFFGGIAIAYLLNPLIKFMDRQFFQALLHMRSDKMRKALSLLVSYALVFGLIIIALFFVLPQLITSLTDLINLIPSWYDEILTFINNLEDRYPVLDLEYINTLLNNLGPDMIKTLKNLASNILPFLYNTSVYIVQGVINLFIAVIVSIYMLSDKKLLISTFKSFLFALLPERKARAFIRTCRECNNIFSSFVVGKSIDSLIIGMLCLFLMKIIGLPYALLISVIVGITNMIPYFGPFIGAVPGLLILFLISPLKAFLFLILIFCLQQFDGLILGPRILGNSTGLRPLWIIFAITVGGHFAGVLGMFFGVPLVAIIRYLGNQWLERRLQKKRKPTP